MNDKELEERGQAVNKALEDLKFELRKLQYLLELAELSQTAKKKNKKRPRRN